MADVTYARLRLAEPARWRTTAAAWRGFAQWTGRRADEFVPRSARLRAAWIGAASVAAVARLDALRRGLHLARLGWWEADQVLSEFAAGLLRARALLDAAVTLAGQYGLTVDGDGRVHAVAPVHCGAGDVRQTTTAIGVALTMAARADAHAAGRLAGIITATTADPTEAPPGAFVLPRCGAPPAEVRRWWDGLTAAERRWLVTTEAATIGSLDGVPATYRDMANRLRLDEQRAELDRAIGSADGRQRHRLRELRAGLDFLAGRLADADGARAYLLRLDLAEEGGRVVLALGDPDAADNVLTHVPGMTADLASLPGELDRAERVAARAQQFAPGESTSAVLWLDYDAPDFVDEAAGGGRARAGAEVLHRFQDGLRATHGGPPAHQTVLGHSYGSLVVGLAATRPGLAADSVIFLGSPGVGVDAATQLAVPTGQVWSSTSRSDVIQYAAVAPGGLLSDVLHAAAMPVVGPLVAFGRPEDDLWFGHNPSDGDFGARVFASQPDAGHLGYWDSGRPALDNLARITLGGTHQTLVTPR